MFESVLAGLECLSRFKIQFEYMLDALLKSTFSFELKKKQVIRF